MIALNSIRKVIEMKQKKPFITVGIIVINVIVFFIMEFLGDTEDSYFMATHGAMYPEYILNDGEYWRIFTATFLHFGINHLMNNMVVLGCSGNILEDALGHVKFLILYLISGIGAGVLSYLQMVHYEDYAVSAGASGAIFGVIGALLWIVVRNKGRYETLTGKGLLFMIALTFYYGITEGGVDNWDHAGGLIMGFLLAIIFYRKRVKNVDFVE